MELPPEKLSPGPVTFAVIVPPKESTKAPGACAANGQMPLTVNAPERVRLLLVGSTVRVIVEAAHLLVGRLINTATATLAVASFENIEKGFISGLVAA